MKHYDTIITGAGPAGLYCACALAALQSENADEAKSILVLEKKARPGRKLLMSGAGQCNITHAGSIKDFLSHYGDSGKLIRSVLQKHSNLALMSYIESLGVPLTEREDGKVFPLSLSARDVLACLLAEAARRGVEIVYGAPLTQIEVTSGGYEVQVGETTRTVVSTDASEQAATAGGRQYSCRKLVIAAGGCSYPGTGSDGSIFGVLERDLGLEIVEPVPALTSVYVENYPYSDLTGLSFNDAALAITNAGEPVRTARGDLLFTRKNLSGPLIINNSRYMRPGTVLSINFLAPAGGPETAARFKRDFPGNGKSPQTYMSDDLHLPKRFAQQTAQALSISDSKVSRLGGAQINQLAAALTAAQFTVSGLASFKEAMVTKGGVSLDEIDLRTMAAKRFDGLYFAGEVIDIDGDTGGYNLQFAYSSACAAAAAICL